MGGNYEKNMFRHLQETIEKVDRLTHEIAALKKEHAKEIEVLKAENQQLKKENQTLRIENQKLKDIINKNSSNSSKPPSSDSFVKIQNSREKSGKRPGGQPGHRGKIPVLFKNPTEIKDIKAKKCKCGGKVKYSNKYKAKQFVDIEIGTKVVEYREHEGVCECCGSHVKNQAPVNDIITYGNNLKSLSAMLSLEGMVSINRIKQMLCELTGGQINLSEGTISKWNKDLSGHVTPAVFRVKEKLMTASVLHKDETGVRVNKTQNWFHVLGNERYTLYFCHKKRGNDADREMGVLSAYSGVLVHNHLKGLYYFICAHAECNAHILRYLKAAIESKKRRWAQDMIALLLDAKAVVKNNDGKALGEDVIAQIHRRYDKILEQGREEFRER